MLFFNDMPDDCIRLVLSQLAVSRLLPVRAVCSKWQTVIESLCLTRSSLKLFFKSGDLVSYCKDLQKGNLQCDAEFRLTRALGGDPEDVLLIPNGSHPDTGLFLAQMFPNVTNLVYCLYNWDTFIYLLTQWCSNLESLTVLDMLPDEGSKFETTFATINSLKCLQNLHLFYLFQCQIPRPLEIMHQLERLTISHYSGDIAPILGQLGASCKKLQILSCHCSAGDDHLPVRRLFPEDLLNNLTHLGLYCSKLGYDGDEMLNEVLGKCKEIMYIDLNFLGFT